MFTALIVSGGVVVLPLRVLPLTPSECSCGFLTAAAQHKQEEASAAVWGRVSHQVCVSVVKPRGQVLGSTLAQKSG